MDNQRSYPLAVVAVGVALTVLFAGAATIIALNRQVPQELWASASALSGALVGILIPTPGQSAGPDRATDAASIIKDGAVTSAADEAQHHLAGPASGGATKAQTAISATKTDATVKQMTASNQPASAVIDAVVKLFEDARDQAQARRDALPNGATQADRDSANADVAVHTAAATGANNSKAVAQTVSSLTAAPSASAKSKITTQQVLLIIIGGVLLILGFALAYGISSGFLHAQGCALAAGGKTQSCDSNLLQIGTAALSLASGAGGTILGLFATPDGKPASAPAGK